MKNGNSERIEAMADLVDLVTSIAREVRHGAPQGSSSGSASASADVVRLSSPETAVMRHVDRNPGVTAGELAAATGLQRSNLSTALRSLEASGLIERRLDGRSVHVHPTARAAQNLALLRDEWAARVEAALGGEAGSIDTALELLRSLEGGLIRARRESRPPSRLPDA